METLLNWVADVFSKSDIIDMYFIVSDLKDIPISAEERAESYHCDAQATAMMGESHNSSLPHGKVVY